MPKKIIMTNLEETNLSPLIVGTMRLGLWGAQMNSQQLQEFIEESIEFGLTTFDHADIYGDYTTEADFGKVLKNNSSLRTKLQLITKCGIRRVCANRPDHKIKSYDSSPEHIKWSVENSLKELATDYIDVLLIHRPDHLMDPNEVAEVIFHLYEAGKVRSFGVSNFTPSQFELLNEEIPLCTNQIEASILALNPFEDGTIDQCLRQGVPPMAWSPLGGGALFQTGEDPRLNQILQVARPLQEKYNCQLDQLLLAWLLRHPAGIQPVLGTSKIERIRDAVGALAIQMDRTDWYDLWQASKGAVLP